MTWLLVIALALAALGLVVFVFKAPRGTWEAVASALLLGIAGYALQGSPGLPGAPKAAQESDQGKAAAALIELRAKMSDSTIPSINHWVVFADGLARNGDLTEAAEMLRGAIATDPKDAEAWLALGNVLLAHADGALTAPVQYAYRRAALADPRAPGAAFFLGLAFAENGRFADARDLWAGLLARAPQDARWRPLLTRQLAALDELIAAQAAQAAQQQAEEGQSFEGSVQDPGSGLPSAPVSAPRTSASPAANTPASPAASPPASPHAVPAPETPGAK